MEKKKILVAMSGGVDSSVAAALLKEKGHEVAGATIRTWASGECADRNTKACCGLSGVEDAREVADRLDIPYWVFNFEAEFKKYVVDYFASEYLKGRTPNPCIACNEHIKFRLFLNRARQMGYDFIATGHYAELRYDSVRGHFCLTEGADASKDQSYVLFPLDPEVLRWLFLPIGKYSKAEIRTKARELQLKVWDKADSQEICFIPSNDYGSFLEREYAEGARPGNIRLKNGEVVGRHNGYFHYTVGQRRGLGVAASERLYVLETNPQTNEVILGKKEEVLNRSCVVNRLNWFEKPDFTNPVRAHVKIRSQHQKAAARIYSVTDEKACRGGFGTSPYTVRVVFDEPQEAITPGQAAVFYEGRNVLGGGWIDGIE